jgi:hypothetical protein
MPITVSVRSEAWTVFARSITRVASSNSTQGIIVLWVYAVFMLFCVLVVVLRRADPPSKESYWLCIGFKNWKVGQVPKVCRVIEKKNTRNSYVDYLYWFYSCNNFLRYLNTLFAFLSWFYNKHYLKEWTTTTRIILEYELLITTCNLF